MFKQDSLLPIKTRDSGVVMKSRWSDSLVSTRRFTAVGGISTVLEERDFHQMIALERKRTERSQKPFLLMLLDAGKCLPSDRSGAVLRNIISALSLSVRES